MEETIQQNDIEKILLCYICKKPVETEKANFDLINNVAIHINPRHTFSQKIKNVFSKDSNKNCTMEYIKTISSTGREISLKEVKINDIFRHCKELFIVINEQEELPPEKKIS